MKYVITKIVIAGQINQNAIDGASYLSPLKTIKYSSIQAFQIEGKIFFSGTMVTYKQLASLARCNKNCVLFFYFIYLLCFSVTNSCCLLQHICLFKINAIPVTHLISVCGLFKPCTCSWKWLYEHSPSRAFNSATRFVKSTLRTELRANRELTVTRLCKCV